MVPPIARCRSGLRKGLWHRRRLLKKTMVSITGGLLHFRNVYTNKCNYLIAVHFIHCKEFLIVVPTIILIAVILCNDLIKQLAKRAFSPKEKPAETEEAREKTPTPDAMDEDTATIAGDETVTARVQSVRSSQSAPPVDGGDTFELSQLLFIVGHVAVKQIVYLQLVEREWKRQKDEKEKGE